MMKYFGVAKVTQLIQFINPNLTSELNYQKNKLYTTIIKGIAKR